MYRVGFSESSKSRQVSRHSSRLDTPNKPKSLKNDKEEISSTFPTIKRADLEYRKAKMDKFGGLDYCPLKGKCAGIHCEYFKKQEENPLLNFPHNPTQYLLKQFLEERVSRAVWAKALAKKILDSQKENNWYGVALVMAELLRVAGEDKK